MVCGAILGDPADPSGQTVSNPVLIVEVLSASTEEEDRGNEWQHYQLVPSLNEYVLVSQTHARIECYRRMASGAWEYRDFTEGTVRCRAVHSSTWPRCTRICRIEPSATAS